MQPALRLQLASLFSQLAAALTASVEAEPPPLADRWLTPSEYAAASATWRPGGAYSHKHVLTAARERRFRGPEGEPPEQVIRRHGRRYLIRADARPRDGRRTRRTVAGSSRTPDSTQLTTARE